MGKSVAMGMRRDLQRPMSPRSSGRRARVWRALEDKGGIASYQSRVTLGQVGFRQERGLKIESDSEATGEPSQVLP